MAAFNSTFSRVLALCQLNEKDFARRTLANGQLLLPTIFAKDRAEYTLQKKRFLRDASHNCFTF